MGENRNSAFQELLFLHRQMGKTVYSYGEKICGKWPDKHVMLLLHLNTVRCRRGYGERIEVSNLMRDMNEIPQSVSRNLRILEQDGLIERHADPKDRRKTYVIITVEGKKIIQECCRQADILEQDVMRFYDQERLEHLYQEYEDLIHAMENAMLALDQQIPEAERDAFETRRMDMSQPEQQSVIRQTPMSGRPAALKVAAPAKVAVSKLAEASKTATVSKQLSAAKEAKSAKENKELKLAREAKDSKGKKAKSKKADKPEKPKKKKSNW